MESSDRPVSVHSRVRLVAHSTSGRLDKGDSASLFLAHASTFLSNNISSSNIKFIYIYFILLILILLMKTNKQTN